MTGNDIVDIKTAAAESNWKRTGYLKKIFTQQEQQYIHAATDPQQMVWRLWSMKESAYKIYTRQYGGRFFAPQKLSCSIINKNKGSVTINNITYDTNTRFYKDHIYSTARPAKISKADFYNCCFALPQQLTGTQQKFIYHKLIATYATMHNTQKNNFSLQKDKNNIPFLYCKKENKQIPVSITHHGNYAAFTIH